MYKKCQLTPAMRKLSPNNIHLELAALLLRPSEISTGHVYFIYQKVGCA